MTARALPALATLVVGAASFAISFVALRDVSATVHAVPAHLAPLVPIVVDGGVICGSATIWLQSREGRRAVFPFVFVAALLIVSVVVNVAHAGPTLLAQGIAALPPLVLLGSLELVAGQTRRLRHTVAQPVAQPIQPVAHTEPDGPLLDRVRAALAQADPAERTQRAIADALRVKRPTLQRAVKAAGIRWDDLVSQTAQEAKA